MFPCNVTHKKFVKKTKKYLFIFKLKLLQAPFGSGPVSIEHINKMWKSVRRLPTHLDSIHLVNINTYWAFLKLIILLNLPRHGIWSNKSILERQYCFMISAAMLWNSGATDALNLSCFTIIFISPSDFNWESVNYSVLQSA